MEDLVTAWQEYIDWFKEQNDDPEIKSDPAANMPEVLVKPSFENFVEWYSSKDRVKFAEDVKLKMMDKVEYTKIIKEKSEVKAGPDTIS